MNPMTEQINKKIILIAAPLFFIILGISVYFAFSEYSLVKKLKKVEHEYEQLAGERGALNEKYAKLEKDRKDLEADFKNVCAERDKLVLQVKGFMIDVNRIKELEGALADSKEETGAARAEAKEIKEQDQNFKEEVARLDAARLAVIKDNKSLRGELSDLKNGREQVTIAGLKQENASLKSEKSKLEAQVKRSDLEQRRLNTDTTKSQEALTKLNLEIRDARSQVAELRRNYAVALNKNKVLEHKVLEVPAKFTEIARQNIVLKKRTAGMHYNLGVFYMNQKEYARATVEFEKSVELIPDDAASHFNLGYIYAEYLVDRKRAVEHFRKYLKSASPDDKDYDWVKRYILTWQTWDNAKPME